MLIYFVTTNLYKYIPKSFFLQNTGIDIVAIKDPWSYQMGFPVITVTEEAGNKLKLTPQRFLSDPGAPPEEPEEPVYKWVGLNIFYSGRKYTEKDWVHAA